MSHQGALFVSHVGRTGIPRHVPAPLPARASDPQASWDAARRLRDSGELSARQRRAFAAVTQTAQTAEQIAAGDYPWMIDLRKRLPELRSLGLVRNGPPCGGVQTWVRA